MIELARFCEFSSLFLQTAFHSFIFTHLLFGGIAPNIFGDAHATKMRAAHATEMCGLRAFMSLLPSNSTRSLRGLSRLCRLTPSASTPAANSSWRSVELRGSNQTNAAILASNQRQTKSTILKPKLAGDTFESATGCCQEFVISSVLAFVFGLHRRVRIVFKSLIVQLLDSARSAGGLFSLFQTAHRSANGA